MSPTLRSKADRPGRPARAAGPETRSVRAPARSARRITGDWPRHLWRPLLVWALLAAVCGALVARMDSVARAGAAERHRYGVETAADYASAYIADRIDRQRERARAILADPVPSQSDVELAAVGLGLAAAAVTDGRGRLLAVTPRSPELIGRDMAQLLEHVRIPVRDNRPNVSSVIISPLIHRPVVAIAVPYATPYGRRILFGPMPVRDSPLGLYIKRTGMRQDERVRLIDRAGNLVIASDATDDQVTPLAAHTPALARALARRPSGAYHTEGAAWIYASAPVQGTSWRIVSSVPAETLYGTVNSTRLVYLSVLAAGAVLTLGAATLIGYSDLQRARADLRTRLLNERLERSNEDLRQSNKDLQQFSYSVAHDLRAPLRAITGFSEILVSECGRNLDDGERDYLHRIANGGRKMATLIDDLLDLARVARVELRTEPVDLSDLTRTVMAGLSDLEPERRVGLSVADDITALGDPELLRLVLENLLGNAWKFTGGTPGAFIEVGSVDVGPGQVGCYVRDNGVGFSPAYADRLFQPFERLHSVKDYPGSGVGLASVRRVIERHGGRIWAQGEPGAGATFTFTLPTVTGDRAAGTPPAGSEAQARTAAGSR